MLRIRIAGITLFFLYLLMAETFFSCQKEATCDCNTDTTTIATIFQLEGKSVKDAIIQSTQPDLNFGNSTFFSAFAWTRNGFFEVSRAFIEFDLSSYPLTTYIKSATLTLYWYSQENLSEQTGENAFTIYRVTQEWDESTITWNNQPAVTETHKVLVPKSKYSNQSYYNIRITDLIQDIISNPAESHGLMIKLNEEIPYKLVTLASSDCVDQSKRPKLTIYY